MKALAKNNMLELAGELRQRLRTILEADYGALKNIVAAWGREPEKSIYRQLA